MEVYNLIKINRVKTLLIFFFLTITGNSFSQTEEELKSIIEKFRLNIINLESEKEWLDLFLHDSITWAMVREGKTELAYSRQNSNFYSSDPRSFFRFLKSNQGNYQEKFYDVKISGENSFASIQFSYSFHKNDKILNWGKEYWSLLKVKNQWKISSVLWTENLHSIDPCPFCNLELIEVASSKYKGYTKEEFTLINKKDSISLNAAFYLPEDNKIAGILIIAHGSAPTTYEDLSYYIRLGTKLNMGVLAFDKRGVGKSTGRYESFTVERSKEWFNLLASDVISAIDWVKSRPDLNALKIGLLGGSQAGWIMPLAASQNKNVDFIIIGEGTSVSAGEEHYFSLLSGDGSGEGISIKEADIQLQSFKGDKGYDPREILKKLQAKTLWFLGTSDPVIPVDATIRVLKELNNPHFKIEILKNGDHNFVNVETGKSYNLVPLIRSWLKSENIIK